MQTRTLIRLAGAGVLGSSLLAGCAAGDDGATLGTTAAPLLIASEAARIEDQYIVVLKDAASAQGLAAAMSRLELRSPRSRLERQYTIIPGFAARLSPEDLEAIRRHPDVAYVEQDQLMSVAATKPAAGPIEIDRHDHCAAMNDGIFDDNGCNGAGVLIYILDTGIRATHAEFGGRVATARGFTAISDGRGTADCNGHGSHAASIAAGAAYGMASAATLVPVRVLGCSGTGATSGIIAGVDHVRANCGAAEKCVANLSFSGGASNTLDRAVTNAVNAGIPFVVAAGNNNADVSGTSPARAPAAITVGCASDTGFPSTDGAASITRCPNSNYGAGVDLWASGHSVLGADDSGDTTTLTLTGSSTASPHVAGAIAQLLGCTSPEPTPAQIEAMLDDKALAGAMASSPTLGGAQNLFLCSDFSDDGIDACACSSEPLPPAPPADSCAQNDACGAQAPAGCFCDVFCADYGDCCPDGPC